MEEFPKFKFLSINDFKKQLDFFEKNFGFLSKDDWNKCLYQNNISDDIKGKVILTFDDAMSCHYKFVFPELKRRGLWGIFYVPSKPYINNEILDVHKIHLLTGKYDGKLLCEILWGLTDSKNLKFKNVKDFYLNTYKEQSNEFGTTEFKRTLNYLMADEQKSKVISLICETLNFLPKFDEFYVSRPQLKDMYKHGMVIGSHSSSHCLMSKLSKCEQNKELKESLDFVKSITKEESISYCHPFGGDHSFNNNTLDLLEQYNVNYSFSVQPRDITSNDLNISRHSLPRYDCNYFPFGKISS